MSKQFSRASFFAYGRTPDSGRKPTTLTESGDRSPKGFGYINTGTRGANENIIMQGGGQPYLQKGAETNESQASQARKGFMGMRSSKLITEHERGATQENRFNRKQAKMRLRGEVF